MDEKDFSMEILEIQLLCRVICSIPLLERLHLDPIFLKYLSTFRLVFLAKLNKQTQKML